MPRLTLVVAHVSNLVFYAQSTSTVISGRCGTGASANVELLVNIDTRFGRGDLECQDLVVGQYKIHVSGCINLANSASCSERLPCAAALCGRWAQ